MQLGYPEFETASSDSFIEAVGAAIGLEPVLDKNLGNNIGIKQIPNTIDSSGQRNSAYDSYYQLAKGRSNLDVFVLAPVSLIVLQPQQSDQYGPTYTASHVVVTDETVGRAYNVTARKEIILSGGARQGPQLLMLSVSGFVGIVTPKSLELTSNSGETRVSVRKEFLTSTVLPRTLSMRTWAKGKPSFTYAVLEDRYKYLTTTIQVPGRPIHQHQCTGTSQRFHAKIL